MSTTTTTCFAPLSPESPLTAATSVEIRDTEALVVLHAPWL